VSAFALSGAKLWSQTLLGPTAFGSAVLVPLQGEATNDVLVATPNGMYPLSGKSGALLFHTDASNQFAAINPGCRSFSTPAVAQVEAGGVVGTWDVFESCGGPPQFGAQGQVAAFALPVQPNTAPAWPMFRGGAAHLGRATRALVGGVTPVGASVS
jgi:hypothetical protein